MPNLDHIAASLRKLAVAVEDLTPDPKNARVHGDRNLDSIKASLKQFGFVAPIVVQKQGMIVRAGNGRLQACKDLGWGHIPAVIVDQNDAEAAAFALADNRTSELAEWDMDALASVISDIAPEGLGDATGFDASEVEKLIATLNVDPVSELLEDVEPPTRPKKSPPKPGEPLPEFEVCEHCGSRLDDAK